MTDMTATSLPHPLPDELVELIARRFRVIGEPMRIKLLDQLRSARPPCWRSPPRSGASQQNVSKHLGVLHDAGIVARRKEGTQVYYRVVDAGVFELCETVCGSVQRQVAELNAIFEGAGR